jgi:flagellum-specific peptidoglycan hydrolase FlgJ
MKSSDRQSRLNEIASIAVRLEAETRVPALAMIAQWAVESQWGAKPVGKFNVFGIKWAPRHALCCTVDTHEVVNGRSEAQAAKFADYPSLEAACRDYAWLISHGAPYARAWAAYTAGGTVDQLIADIAGTYSTSPAYRDLVTGIAHQANVRAAVEAVKA